MARRKAELIHLWQLQAYMDFAARDLSPLDHASQYGRPLTSEEELLLIACFVDLGVAKKLGVRVSKKRLPRRLEFAKKENLRAVVELHKLINEAVGNIVRKQFNEDDGPWVIVVMPITVASVEVRVEQDRKQGLRIKTGFGKGLIDQHIFLFTRLLEKIKPTQIKRCDVCDKIFIDKHNKRQKRCSLSCANKRKSEMTVAARRKKKCSIINNRARVN